MGTDGAGGGRPRVGGVRRRATGGISGDLLGELLASVLDTKTIRTVRAGEGTPAIASSRKVRTFASATTAAERARQVMMRLRTVSTGVAQGLIEGRPSIQVAQQRLMVLRGMQTSARQDPATGRWLPIFAVSTRGASTLRTLMRNAGVTPVQTSLGRGWFTVRR